MVIYKETDTDGAHWYTCVHLDDTTGLCRMYEERPRMCREYPYGEPCTFEGCQA